MWQTNRQTIILLGGSICVVLILGVLAGFLYRFIKTESISLKSAETAIAILEDKEKDLTNAKSSLEALKKDVEKIDQAFLTEESFVSFLKLLESMAGTSRVTFQAERADLPDSAGGKAGLNFIVRGNYPALVNFFTLFDQVPYAGIVDQASFMSDSTKKNVLAMKVHYVIFNFLPPQ